MQSSKSRLEDYFKRKFGVGKSFWEGYQVHERSSSLWIVSEDVEPEGEFMAAGIRALRRTNRGLKPTTYMLQILDDEINENVAELDREKLEKIIFEREKLEDFDSVDKGYVALKYLGTVIGCGMKSGKGLETQIPKSRSKTLRHCLE